MLQNRIVVVTGAGSGLGRALASAFVAQGSHVVGFGRTESALTETAGVIASERFSYHCIDVAKFHDVKQACDQIAAKHGRIDFLFNNAAVYPRARFLDESADAWAEAIAINVNGPANCCKAVLPIMIESGFGRIYNVGSYADRGPIERSAAYSCSKGALHALGKAIAADIAHLGADVEVHEWIPGHLRTQMSEYTGIDPAISAGWAVNIASLPPFGRSCLFENDKEWVPPKRLRQKVEDLVLLRALRRR